MSEPARERASMDFPTLRTQRATLADQIEGHIRDLIVSDRLGPGEILPSSIDLAAEFGVSRTIVREAMKSLQAKGLIEIMNGKRARVRPMTNSVLIDFFDRFARSEKEAVIDLLELRKGVEVQSAILAARRRTEEDRARIWSSVRRMEEALGDPDAFLETDVELHLAIAHASKNRMIFHLVASIREVMRNTMREGVIRHPDQEAWKENLGGHVRLVEAIDRQDEEGARVSMVYHFDRAIDRILREPVVAASDGASLQPAETS